MPDHIHVLWWIFWHSRISMHYHVLSLSRFLTNWACLERRLQNLPSTGKIWGNESSISQDLEWHSTDILQHSFVFRMRRRSHPCIDTNGGNTEYYIDFAEQNLPSITLNTAITVITAITAITHFRWVEMVTV